MNAQERREERRGGWLMALAAGMVLVMLLFTIFYTKHIVAESEKRDCGNLAADIEAYQTIPPTTPTGWNQWRSKLGRYTEIGCVPKLGPLPAVPTPTPSE